MGILVVFFITVLLAVARCNDVFGLMLLHGTFILFKYFDKYRFSFLFSTSFISADDEVSVASSPSEAAIPLLKHPFFKIFHSRQ